MFSSLTRITWPTSERNFSSVKKFLPSIYIYIEVLGNNVFWNYYKWLVSHYLSIILRKKHVFDFLTLLLCHRKFYKFMKFYCKLMEYFILIIFDLWTAVSPTRSVFPDFGPDPDFFPKKVWKKSVFYPKSLFFYKIATYYTFLESLGPGQCNKNIFKMF